MVGRASQEPGAESRSFMLQQNRKMPHSIWDRPLGPAKVSGTHRGFLCYQVELLTYQRKPDGKNNRCKMYCTKETNTVIIAVLIPRIKDRRGPSVSGRVSHRGAWVVSLISFPWVSPCCFSALLLLWVGFHVSLVCRSKKLTGNQLPMYSIHSRTSFLCPRKFNT